MELSPGGLLSHVLGVLKLDLGCAVAIPGDRTFVILSPLRVTVLRWSCLWPNN